MNSTLVVATHNPGKAREFAKLLSGLPLEVVGLDAFPPAPVPEETGTTFTENALLKARDAFATTGGHRSVADDSGLAVDALDGAPGVYSARYAQMAGKPKSDQANNLHLISQLAGKLNRRAHYYCVLVFVRHAADPCPIIAEGVWHGEVVDAPRGAGGFGYDPHFMLPDLGKTAAELPAEEKNAVSHRALALRSLVARLQAEGRGKAAR